MLLIVAFLTLATPLALTLVRVTHEATAVNVARDQLQLLLGTGRSRVAQMDVTWPLLGSPRIAAVVIAPRFVADAEDTLKARMTRRLGVSTEVTLEQVIATTVGERAQAQAQLEVSASRSNAIAAVADAAPVEEFRRRAGVPLRAAWFERSSREVFLAADEMRGWSLRDYRQLERLLNWDNATWRARIVPPNAERIAVSLLEGGARDSTKDDTDVADAVWALKRLAVRSVMIESRIDSRATPDSLSVRHADILTQLRAAADSAGIAVQVVALRDTVRPVLRRGASPRLPDRIDLVLTPLRPAARQAAASSTPPRPVTP
jgi:hypothetical protein